MSSWKDSIFEQIERRNSRETLILETIFVEHDELFEKFMLLLKQRDNIVHKLSCLEYQTQDILKQSIQHPSYDSQVSKIIDYFQKQFNQLRHDLLPFEQYSNDSKASIQAPEFNMSKVIFEQQVKLRFQEEEIQLAKQQLQDMMQKNVSMDEENRKLKSLLAQYEENKETLR